jgi:pimeloyl-ACP methyl ester carboxylesterase
LLAMIGLIAAFLLAAAGDGAALELRYDLRPGDRVVYKQTLRREGTGSDFDYETRAQWTTQVIVTATREGRSVVGFQRNRDSFELVRYREKGRDRTNEERNAFVSRLPPARLAEANRVGQSGLPDLPWSALRESTSELLPGLHEVEALPSGTVKGGDAWKGWGLLRLDFRAVGPEDASGVRCFRIDGTMAPSDARLRLWFGLESGVVERLEFEGAYATVGVRIHETLVLERLDRRRGEDPFSWVEDPDTRQGALAAFLISSTPAIPEATVHRLLEVDDISFRRQVLAYAYRRRVAPPPPETLATLTSSDDPRVRALSARLAREGPEAVGPRRFAEEPPGTTLRPMTTAGFEGWPYVIHVPEDYRGDEPLPLLISLSGGPGRALLGVPGAREELGRLGWLVVFPQAMDLWWSPRSTTIVSTLLDEILRRFNVDTNRVYLSGSSNGGTGTFLYATLWPHRLAAAVSLMGAGMLVEGDPPLPPNLNGLPLLLAHGDKDPIIPLRASQETLKAVRHAAMRAQVEIKVLPGHGHDLFLGGDDDLVARFLEGRVRDPFPRRVTLATRDLAFPRRFWVELLAKDGGVAEIEAEVSDDNHIRLQTKNVRRLRLLLRRELLHDGGSIRVTLNGKEAFSGDFVEDTDRLARTGQATADPFLGWSMEIPLEAGR